MRRLHMWVSVFATAVAAACASTADEDSNGRITEPTVTGLDLSAEVSEITTNSNPPTPYPKVQFNVQVSVLNNTSSEKTIAYRSGCSVRLQLRTSTDAVLYDETKRACDLGITTLRVPPQSQRSLFSGIRFPAAVLGDSIAPGRYRVIAVLQTDENPVYVEAGSYSIPQCDSSLGCRQAARGDGASR